MVNEQNEDIKYLRVLGISDFFFFFWGGGGGGGG